MNKRQRNEKIKLLEDLVNAQQELITIHSETIDVIDSADNAVATIVDPYQETVLGKDLHDVRALHYDRELELISEIESYFKILDGKVNSE